MQLLGSLKMKSNVTDSETPQSVMSFVGSHQPFALIRSELLNKTSYIILL